MPTTDVYFKVPDKRVTICLSVVVGTYNAIKTSEHLTQMMGATAQEITKSEYNRLTKEYTVLSEL